MKSFLPHRWMLSNFEKRLEKKGHWWSFPNRPQRVLISWFVDFLGFNKGNEFWSEEGWDDIWRVSKFQKAVTKHAWEIWPYKSRGEYTNDVWTLYSNVAEGF